MLPLLLSSPYLLSVPQSNFDFYYKVIVVGAHAGAAKLGVSEIAGFVLRFSAPRVRNAKAWGIALGETQAVVTALKARNIPGGEKVLLAIHNSYDGSFPSRAFSAFYLTCSVLGRCRRLLHFAPLALS
jgi:hypothetical protein